MTAVARPFIPIDRFIENGFERRFQPLILESLLKGLWFVIGAVSGSGKSKGIADLIHRYCGLKALDGKTEVPILTARAPKNNRSEIALGIALSKGFGLTPNMSWAVRSAWLPDEIARANVRTIVIDDAHDLSIEHMLFLKELTDNLEAPPFERKVGLCLVCATDSSATPDLPIAEMFKMNEGQTWRQLRRRFDPTKSYRRVLGHTCPEIGEILAGYEGIYREQFPDLRLVDATESIYGYLTDPALDPFGSGRVPMDSIKWLVVKCLERATEEGLTHVPDEILLEQAELMTLLADVVKDVDGEPEIVVEDMI